MKSVLDVTEQRACRSKRCSLSCQESNFDEIQNVIVLIHNGSMMDRVFKRVLLVNSPHHPVVFFIIFPSTTGLASDLFSSGFGVQLVFQRFAHLVHLDVFTLRGDLVRITNYYGSNFLIFLCYTPRIFSALTFRT
jgi:hypothetical protein